MDRLAVQPERFRVCPTCRVKYGKERIRCLVAEAFIEARANEHAATESLASSGSTRRLSPGGTSVVDDAAIAAAAVTSEQDTNIVRIIRRPERVSRLYQIIADGNVVEVRAGPGMSSKKRSRKLPFGSYVQIMEIMTIEHRDEAVSPSKGKKKKPTRRGLIRGRLDAAMGEGWITLSESGISGRTYAVHVEPGSYQVAAPSVAVTSSLNLDSERLPGDDGTIRSGDCIDIVALRHLPSRGDRVRGKLATGGWITVLDGQNGRELARPFRRGVYATVARSTEITDGVRRATIGKKRLEAGRCMQIINTVYSPQDGCVRGQLSSATGGGWVSILDKTDWRIHVQFLPLGAYQIHASRSGEPLHVRMRPGGCTGNSNGRSSASGGNLRPIPAGSYIEVVETTYIDRENMVRGRLLSGGWCNLLDTLSGIVYASPVPTGVYITTDVSISVQTRAESSTSSGTDNVTAGRSRSLTGAATAANTTKERSQSLTGAMITTASPSSAESNGKVKTLPRYSTIEVTECHFLKTNKCVRARLASGGWITLINATGGVAKPIMVGPYVTTIPYSAVHRNVRIEKASEVMRLPAGRLVDVVETRYVDRDGGHIRGRLASGGWISLVNVEDNVQYAKKIDRPNNAGRPTPLAPDGTPAGAAASGSPSAAASNG